MTALKEESLPRDKEQAKDAREDARSKLDEEQASLDQYVDTASYELFEQVAESGRLRPSGAAS